LALLCSFSALGVDDTKSESFFKREKGDGLGPYVMVGGSGTDQSKERGSEAASAVVPLFLWGVSWPPLTASYREAPSHLCPLPRKGALLSFHVAAGTTSFRPKNRSSC